MLQPLNPLAQAPTKLGRVTPTPLEIGYKRLGMEQEQGIAKAKLDMERKKLGQKEQLQAQKDLTPKIAGGVFVNHQALFAKDVDKYFEDLGEAIRLHSEGKGDNPYQPGSNSYNELMKRRIYLEQKVSDKKVFEEGYKAQRAAIEANPGAFMPDALQKLDEEYANEQYYTTGTYPKSIPGLWDWEGAVEGIVKQIKPKQVSQAGPSADGGAYSYKKEYVPEETIRMNAELLAADPHAEPSAKMRFDALPKAEQDNVLALKEQQGMSLAGAMFYKDMKAKIGEAQETRTYTQPGGAGIGAKKDEAAVNFVLEVLDGLESGNLGGKAWSDYVTDDGANRSTSIFNDLSINKRTIKIAGEPGDPPKIVESNDVVTGTTYNPKTGMYAILWKNDVTGDTGTMMSPKKEADAQFAVELVGLNKDRMGGAGTYFGTMEKLREGKLQGSDAQNIRKSQRQGGAMNPPSNTAGEAD